MAIETHTKQAGDAKDKVDYECVICQSEPRVVHLFHPQMRVGGMVALCAKRVQSGEEVKRYGARSQPQIDILKRQGRRGNYRLCEECEKARINDEALYCVAVEIIEKPRNARFLKDVMYRQEMEYIHAKSQQQALIEFKRSGLHRGKRIIAAGLVIGYHSADDHGERLYA